MLTDDRRRFQRLKLSTPIMALLGGESALLLDLGITGAFVEHHGAALPGELSRLSFRWEGHELEFIVEVTRSIVVREASQSRSGGVVSHTGFRFHRMSARTEELLADMMATYVGRLLVAHRANAIGEWNSEHDAVLGRVGEARRARARGFMTYHFRGGVWSTFASSSPEQPEDGFTVSAFEDQEDLEVLCGAYEVTDEEGRRLIRLVAELSARPAR